MNDDVKKNKGNYCLIISNKRDSNIKVGAKGMMFFKKGYYVYVGSALNSLDKRIERHISEEKKKHWHVDYLLLDKNTKIKEVIFTYSTKKIECEISNEINKNSDGYIELFGCSDCKCLSVKNFHVLIHPYMCVYILVLLCCCLVTQLCQTLCDPMNCSMPDSSVLHYLPLSDSCPLSQ